MTRLQDIPWVRILAESVAIVASILLAFAVDAWWADRQIQVDVQENLLTHIDDGELRPLLAALPTDYDDVRQFELMDAESTVNHLYPYITTNGSFNQTANTQFSGCPGTGEFLALLEPDYRVIEHRDHSQLHPHVPLDNSSSLDQLSDCLALA
jgi:hypothetical protein